MYGGQRSYRSAWEGNAWRDENPKIRPDLSVANLSRADLGGADLVEANLQIATPVSTDLTVPTSPAVAVPRDCAFRRSLRYSS
jgi:Pentapeptide repeats (8 copies)